MRPLRPASEIRCMVMRENKLMTLGKEAADLYGRNVTVVGLGRSGIGAAQLLSLKGARVSVTDARSARRLKSEMEGLPEGVSLSLGGHPEHLFKGADMVVVSPGVPSDIEPLRLCRGLGIPVIGELELAYMFTDIPFLAITGTNGKSTVTALTGEMMGASGLDVFVGGNIGSSIAGEICLMERRERSVPDWIVAEVSSFQLESVRDFRPAVAAILNLSPDHMDRYDKMEDYRLAKTRIFLNQRAGDSLVLNADDEAVASLAGRAPGRVAWFSRLRAVERGVFIENGDIVFRLDGSGGRLLAADSLGIIGLHNLENAIAAACISLLAGAEPERVAEALESFRGLEHRLEKVDEFEGVTYINDSKGTNTGAVLKSLASFSEPVILIAGGRDKGTDFSILAPEMTGRVKLLVLIGEAADKMAAELGGLAPVLMAADMDDAVEKASRAASGGDVVLLSPACASFDMFSDFEQRGRAFKDAVRRLHG